MTALALKSDWRGADRACPNKSYLAAWLQEFAFQCRVANVGKTMAYRMQRAWGRA